MKICPRIIFLAKTWIIWNTWDYQEGFVTYVHVWMCAAMTGENYKSKVLAPKYLILGLKIHDFFKNQQIFQKMMKSEFKSCFWQNTEVFEKLGSICDVLACTMVSECPQDSWAKIINLPCRVQTPQISQF